MEAEATLVKSLRAGVETAENSADKLTAEIKKQIDEAKKRLDVANKKTVDA
jgi:hypothetical protein